MTTKLSGVLDAALFPSEHARLMVYDGLSHEQAFDVLADRAARPACQAVIAELETTPKGRQLLAQLRGYWSAEGLPVPWDNVLELGKRDRS